MGIFLNVPTEVWSRNFRETKFRNFLFVISRNSSIIFAKFRETKKFANFRGILCREMEGRGFFSTKTKKSL